MGTEITTGHAPEVVPELATERLRLRPLGMADGPRIRTFAGELAVARWLARVPHPYPDGEAERFITDCLDAGAHVWAIERRGEPGLIGTVGIDGAPGKETLGYWLGVPFWGRGFAGEAARAAVDWTFGEAQADSLASGVFEGNAASLRVQERLGFVMTGRRMVACRALGIDRPHIDTALCRADWEAGA